MVLSEQNLVNTVRKLSDNVQKMIWIITPFIGSWNSIEKILGRKWLTEYYEFRLLTDIKNEYLINKESYERFKHRAKIKTLRGLHAKIYIFDNSAIISSANLTNTAFSKRYEIGHYYKNIPNELELLINKWWEKAKFVDSSWSPREIEKNKYNEEEGNIVGLKTLWKLPETEFTIKVFKDFEIYLNAYNHFKDIYTKITPRILDYLPIFHEIDAFFNFLFHEHTKKPSRRYLEHSYRKLTDNQRIREIKKYVSQFEKWLNKNPTFEDYRIKRIELIQNKLSPVNIENLTYDDLEMVVDSLHCMNSLPLNRKRFLNSRNNSYKNIIKEWKNLLHNSNLSIEEKMERCNKNLNYFGKSAIQELLSWYFPNKYPVINRNSNSSLKFFGYDVRTY